MIAIHISAATNYNSSSSINSNTNITDTITKTTRNTTSTTSNADTFTAKCTAHLGSLVGKSLLKVSCLLRLSEYTTNRNF